jgi:Tfp pilus assembly protein PilO
MQERWKRVTTRLEDRKDELANLRRAAQNQGQYGDVRQEIASMIFETPDLAASQRVVPAFINQVEGLGQRRRLQITRYEPLPVKIEDNYAVYSLSLSFRADLPELVAFLEDIQDARPIISIRRLHVTPPGPNAETPELTIELLLSTFAIERPVEEEAGTKTTSTGTADTG